MRKAGALVVTAFFGLLSDAAFADDVPKLDFNKSCRTDVAAYPGGGGNKACITDEQRARKTLISQWKQFGRIAGPGAREWSPTWSGPKATSSC